MDPVTCVDPNICSVYDVTLTIYVRIDILCHCTILMYILNSIQPSCDVITVGYTPQMPAVDATNCKWLCSVCSVHVVCVYCVSVYVNEMMIIVAFTSPVIATC